eukprot:GHRR01024550.1.p1 GENE.GHRR01024550.1~~GHRR01024550.1.p1  ORF type:complete len:252 (+),score=76.18 GHRR01024550.1:1263-2018(+)
MADTVKLQDELYKEMRGRIKEEDTSVAARYQGYYYYTRAEEGQQYAVHCRRAVPARAGPPSEADEPSPDAPEEVLLDENKRKQQGKHKFYMVGCCETSPDQKLLAWTEDTKGGEKYTLHIRDLSNGKELIDPIPMTSGDVVWANDNATLFYIVKDHLDRPYKVLRHTIGSPTSYDAVVYEEKDEVRKPCLMFLGERIAFVAPSQSCMVLDKPAWQWLQKPYQVDWHNAKSSPAGAVLVCQARDEVIHWNQR